jgi:hypothetical protein
MTVTMEIGSSAAIRQSTDGRTFRRPVNEVRRCVVEFGGDHRCGGGRGTGQLEIDLFVERRDVDGDGG